MWNDIQISNVMAFLAVLGVIILAAYMASKRTQTAPVPAYGNGLANTVAQLSADLARAQDKIRSLEAELLATRTELLATKNELVEALADSKNMTHRIDELEATLGQYSTSPRDHYPPMLAIFGPDDGISDRDTLALRRAGVDYLRLRPATQSDIMSKLRAARKDGCVWRWIHISSHGGIFPKAGPNQEDVTGILLVDDNGVNAVAPVAFFADAFITGEIAVMMLASCSSSELADELAGIIGAVVYFNEGVPNEGAEDFTEAFWRRIVQGVSPGQAYLESRREVPSVKDYAFIRQPRKAGKH